MVALLALALAQGQAQTRVAVLSDVHIMDPALLKQDGEAFAEYIRNGRNVLDEKYIVDAGNSGRQLGFPTYVGGSRSVFGLMLKVGF